MTVSLRSQIAVDGFLAETFELARPSLLSSLPGEAKRFDDALAQYARNGEFRVPYIVTDPIAEVALDERIGEVVAEVLGTDAWVMWGSNIRREIPNQAHRWHTDRESALWSTVTLAIALHACRPEGATWFMPGSQLAKNGPGAGDDELERALRAERARGVAIREPQQPRGWANGRCMLFDARCWHRGDPRCTEGRLVLFLHYQRADAKRIPLMLDYQRGLWSSEPAPYIASAGARSVETRVARPPRRNRFASALDRLRSRA